jgi:hypothetical protein
MSYHWHDDEFDWCPCDEREEGRPIRESDLRKQGRHVPRPREASRREEKPRDAA